MRPDAFTSRGGAQDRRPADGHVPFDAAALPDPELDALSADLASAGERARADRQREGRERPDGAFASRLRERLLAELPSTATLVPSAAASVLLVPTGSGRAAMPGPDSIVADRGDRPVRVAASVSLRTATVLPAPRWTALLIAAALILSVVGLRTEGLFPVLPATRAGDVVGATLVRDARETPLVPGADLRTGDRVVVADGGRAILQLGDSQARLGGGATVEIASVSGAGIAIEQLGGRVYHRVGVPAGASYVVATGGVTWTARGTAFDLDRQTGVGGGIVRELSIEHGVTVEGAGLSATIEAGSAATVTLAEDGPTLSTGRIAGATLTDPWLVENARHDAATGLPLGIMAGVDLTAADPSLSSPSSASDGLGGSSEAGSPTPTLEPTIEPTPRATPKPTPKPPKPTPTPTPAVATLSLAGKACGGGIILDWTGYEGDAFDHYTTLRTTGETIPLAYPPGDGVVDFGTSYTTNVSKTDAFDDSAGAGLTVRYRTMAFDAGGRVIGASPIMSFLAKPVAELGALTVGPEGAATAFGWTPFDGPEACYSFYKLVYSAEDATPSYLTGATYAWYGSDRLASTAVAEGLAPGTYWFRLQVLRETSLGAFVAAESDVTQYTVP